MHTQVLKTNLNFSLLFKAWVPHSFPSDRNSHLLCSAFGMFGSQMKGHQSLERPLPSADIAEHRASYISALLGLCLQSETNQSWDASQQEQRPAGNTSTYLRTAQLNGSETFTYQQDDSFKDEFWIYAHIQELKA